MSSELVNFYRGGVDDRGRTLDEILAWERGRLEAVHDYIQWVFPLPERSMANPDAPVLSAEDIRTFRADPDMQGRMRRALAVMRAFYGLEPRGPRPWLTPGNHNYLRLTRILRSLRSAGLEAEARALFAEIEAVHRENAGAIGTTTFDFWRRAME